MTGSNRCGQRTFDKAFFKTKRRRGTKKNRGKRQAISDRKNYLRYRERKSLHHRDREKTEIMLEIEKNYRICSRVYQSLFLDVVDTLIQYINTLDLDEIKQLDNDLKTNGWG